MSICDCSCDIDYERPSVHTEKKVKARKQYTCCECSKPIEVGQKYELVKGLWDGEWSTFRTCILCARIRADLCPQGFIYGELRETISECLGFDYVTGEEEENE